MRESIYIPFLSSNKTTGFPNQESGCHIHTPQRLQNERHGWHLRSALGPSTKWDRALWHIWTPTSLVLNILETFSKGVRGSEVLRSMNIQTLTKLLLQVMQRRGYICVDYNCSTLAWVCPQDGWNLHLRHQVTGSRQVVLPRQGPFFLSHFSNSENRSHKEGRPRNSQVELGEAEGSYGVSWWLYWSWGSLWWVCSFLFT